MQGYKCQKLGCGDTITYTAHVCLTYKHVYEIRLCEKHKKELEELERR